ncbi:unnamed protein product [Leptidea sinapis]|uniref:ENT domain-containing protein n=1 Tax=Leptidea sinapis TaxID=189913 RepID=A0A5E4PUW6_9NEOP|nr:unnamed protein product [Leptidea sinapis]
MWPLLLNMTRDECRRTLRRLELEAYSNMMSVFRAQGALEENRTKLLEELRAVLHISHDRHSAEARRVSNDELLATIAEHLAGPNTGLRWISEGRRKIPLLPRGIPQTMYTEVADKVSETTVLENKEIQNRIEIEKLEAARTDQECLQETDGQTECPMDIESGEDAYSPIALEDHTAKIWDTEIICRKRKIQDESYDNTAVKNKRNIPVNANQRHLNLSQVYSKFSQPAVSKSSSQSKHSYNTVSKVSTSKSNQTRAPRTRKPRQNKQQKQPKSTTKQNKKSKNVAISPNNQYNPVSLHLDISANPNTFQASYAQSVLANKNRKDFTDDNTKTIPSGISNDSHTMRLITQPETIPHEPVDSENTHPNNPIILEPKTISVSKPNVSKPCQLVLQKRDAEKRIQVSDYKIVQKSNENVKLHLTSRPPVFVAPTSTPRTMNTPGKLVTTKVIGSIPKPRTTPAPVISEKMVVVSKPLADHRITHPKINITSSSTSTPIKTSLSASFPSKTTESLTPKGIPATDLRVSAKTFVLNPKSAQKMVVLPVKTSKEGQPMFHFKGIPTPMKLVSVSSQPNTSMSKSNPLYPKPAVVNTFPTNAKILGVEPIKTANLADIVPVKGLTPATQKITNPMVRPVNPKGNVIVVQKSATIGKALTFTKNGNDMSKIIMGKNVNKLLQAKKSEPGDPSNPGNVIVLELNNEQSGRTTTLSEILDSRGTSTAREMEHSSGAITADTPVLFDNQIVEANCNQNSLDSTTSISDIVPMQDAIEKNNKSNFSHREDLKNSSSVTEWEMELETVSRKEKDEDDKLNSLHLDLGMSSESDSEYIVGGKGKSEHSSQDSLQQETQRGMSREMYSGSSGISLATRTMLSQLQDEESSNDSSFALKAKKSDAKDIKIDKSDLEALSKAKAKLTQKVAEAQSRQKRIDVYSTAITSSEINLDSFSYLDEGLMTGDDVFAHDNKRENRTDVLDEHLSYLGEDSANSTDSQTVSESLTSNEQ